MADLEIPGVFLACPSTPVLSKLEKLGIEPDQRLRRAFELAGSTPVAPPLTAGALVFVALCHLDGTHSRIGGGLACQSIEARRFDAFQVAQFEVATLMRGTAARRSRPIIPNSASVGGAEPPAMPGV